MKAFMMQCQMEVKRTLRNKIFVGASILMPIMFYYIFTNVVNTKVPDQDAWQAEYLMSMTVFSVISSSIFALGLRLVQENAAGWAQLIRITPLSSTAYFGSKIAAQLVINCFTIIAIFLAGYFINGVELSAYEWIMSGTWILLGSIPFLALGTLIGTFKRIDTAAAIGNVLQLGLAILGGLWMPFYVLPDMMQNIGQWLPSYQYGTGAWGIIKGNTPTIESVGILLGYLVLFMALSIYIRRRQEAV
ncbi:ABC transporter permease [Priestia taiwanensis]|uniref:Transport permease YvfS n=1 Tax=Priestia taiwanensis TaxID=1347902 RepID=A0A917ERN0_9BACI|nr:ABC transporter permease [Priestia taiwanensis]GGE82239.1 putative transport permease YvfS [Priestia taiwanensis]